MKVLYLMLLEWFSVTHTHTTHDLTGDSEVQGPRGRVMDFPSKGLDTIIVYKNFFVLYTNIYISLSCEKIFCMHLFYFVSYIRVQYCSSSMFLY